jgi:hypothetical protein
VGRKARGASRLGAWALLAHILNVTSVAAQTGQQALDLSKHNRIADRGQRIEAVLHQLEEAFPLGTPVTEVIAALQQGHPDGLIAALLQGRIESGGFCELRTDVENTYYCQHARVFAADRRLATTWNINVQFDPGNRTVTRYAAAPGSNIFLPELHFHTLKRSWGQSDRD